MMTWDLRLLEKINQEWMHPLLDFVMPAVSAIEVWIPLIAVVVILVAWRGRTKARLMLLCLALAIGIGDGVISKNIKEMNGRVRPRDALSGVIIRDLGRAKPAPLRLFQPLVIKRSKASGQQYGNSFPSSHTMNLFAAAIVVLCFYKGWGLVVLGLAFTVAWSRVYCGAHWPSDIPLSASFGVAVGFLTVVLVGRGWQWWLGRLKPLCPNQRGADGAAGNVVAGRSEPLRRHGR